MTPDEYEPIYQFTPTADGGMVVYDLAEWQDYLSAGDYDGPEPDKPPPLLTMPVHEVNRLLRAILTGPAGPPGATGAQGLRGRSYDEGLP